MVVLPAGSQRGSGSSGQKAAQRWTVALSGDCCLDLESLVFSDYIIHRVEQLVKKFFFKNLIELMKFIKRQCSLLHFVFVSIFETGSH